MCVSVCVYMQHHNPFAFRHVTHLKSTAHFDDMGPCVMMATPSGLQSGTSREVFETWCDDRRNTVIICDFAVQVCACVRVCVCVCVCMRSLGAHVRARVYLCVMS